MHTRFKVMNTRKETDLYEQFDEDKQNILYRMTKNSSYTVKGEKAYRIVQTAKQYLLCFAWVN
jgi:hypothetical protein